MQNPLQATRVGQGWKRSHNPQRIMATPQTGTQGISWKSSLIHGKIWDKKIKEFIDFVAKMRQKPGLVGSPIYVPTKVSGPRKEPEVITIPDPTSPPPSQKSQSGRVSPPD